MEGLSSESSENRLERLNKAAQQEARRKAGIPEPAEVKTHKETIDAEDQRLGAFIKSQNKPEYNKLQEKLKEGTATASDLRTMTKIRKEYAERVKEVDKLMTFVDNYVDDMIRESPNLRDVVETVGRDVFVELLKQGLEERSTTDKRSLDEVMRRFSPITDFEERENKPMTKKINDFCTKYELNSEDQKDKIHLALQNDNESQRISALMSLAQPGWWAFRRKREIRQFAKANNLVTFKARRDIASLNVGNYLNMILDTTHPEIGEALVRVANGQEPGFKNSYRSTMTFQEMKEKKDLPKQVSQEAAMERLKAFRAKHGEDIRKGGEIGQALEDEYFAEEDRIVSEFNKYQKKGGFWSNIWTGVMGILDAFVASDDSNKAYMKSQLHAHA